MYVGNYVAENDVGELGASCMHEAECLFSSKPFEALSKLYNGS